LTGIRHFTASAIVFDDRDRVLLVHHNKLGMWLYPGGHIDPNEDPAQAAVREVHEETGIHVEVITGSLFQHPAVTSHPTPFAIIEMPIKDAKVGPHHHIDMVYLCRAATTDLTHQPAEVGGCTWVPVAEVATLNTPEELSSLVSAAAGHLSGFGLPAVGSAPRR
jgi:8-oxo-dGTP pyrophosphatase MutT (NUDIX family)